MGVEVLHRGALRVGAARIAELALAPCALVVVVREAMLVQADQVALVQGFLREP